MKLSKIIIGTALLVGILSAAGCNNSATSVLQLNGHYDGSLTLQVHEMVGQTDDVSYNLTQVGTDVDISGKSDSSVVMKDSGGNSVLTLTLSDFGDDSLSLQSSTAIVQPIKLTIDPTSQCYVGSDAVKVTLCTANLEISLEIQNPKDGTDLVSAILYRKADGAGPVKEAPVSFDLNDALTRARTMSFTSRIEFEHVVQAKLTAKAAYLHLLPQISLNTVLSNLTPSWSSLLMTIGDLAPFLLPDRWMQADAHQQQSKAEQDTQILMRLDMGVQVEGLFYSYQRDKNSRDLTQAMLNKLTDPVSGIRHQVAVREADGELPIGSTPNIDLLINQIQQTLIVLDQVKIEDLGTISQTLGYFDPKTVIEATVPALGNMDSVPDTLDYQTIRDEAYSRSFERDQMDDLMAAANDTKNAEYWNFLDPYGDPNLFLSFALPSLVSVAQSQINELQIDKQQIESILEQKVLNAVTDYTAAVSGYKKAQAGMVSQNKVLNQELQSLQDGTNVDFVGLSVILQQYLAGQIAVESAIAAYGVAQSEVNRLLLQGNYAKF